MDRTGNHVLSMARLAKDVLAEIPDQFISYMKSRGIKPNPAPPPYTPSGHTHHTQIWGRPFPECVSRCDQPHIATPWNYGIWLMEEQQATGSVDDSVYRLSGTLWDAKAFLLQLLFPACFLWDNSMINEAHFSDVFFVVKTKQNKKNLGSWLFLFWGSELRWEEENDVCGFNSCLSVVVSVYLDGYFLLWPLTLLHIGVLCAFRWSFLILFLVAFSTSETCSCGTFAHHLS